MRLCCFVEWSPPISKHWVLLNIKIIVQNHTIYACSCCLRKTFFPLAQNSLKRPIPLSVFFIFLNVLWGSILYSKLCLSIFLLILFYIWVDYIVNITDLKTVDCAFIGTFALILFRDLRCLFSLFLVYFTYTLSKLMRQNKSMWYLQATSTKARVPKERKYVLFPCSRRCRCPACGTHSSEHRASAQGTHAFALTILMFRVTCLPCCPSLETCGYVLCWSQVLGPWRPVDCRVFKSRSSEVCTAKQRERASSHRRLWHCHIRLI